MSEPLSSEGLTGPLTLRATPLIDKSVKLLLMEHYVIFTQQGCYVAPIPLNKSFGSVLCDS